MKTILYPVDFSPSSDRISRYAAQLAADAHAKVVLVAAPAKLAKVPAGDWPEDTSERLGELHDQLTESYHIACAVEDEVISGNVYKKLSTTADSYDLMILGLQFDKSMRLKHSAGLDLVRVIQETLAPLLIVPEKFGYKKVTRLLYAYDYKHEPEPPLMQLHWLADWFNAEVRFISILPSDISVQEEEKVNSVQNRIANQWHSGKKLSFESIVYDDVPKCLEHYLSMWRVNDLLVLSVNHQNMLERLWHRSVVKKLLKCAAQPYLILHK